MSKNSIIMLVDVNLWKLCEEMKEKGETRSLRESTKKIADGLKGFQAKRKSKKIIEDDWNIFMPM